MIIYHYISIINKIAVINFADGVDYYSLCKFEIKSTTNFYNINSFKKDIIMSTHIYSYLKYKL